MFNLIHGLVTRLIACALITFFYNTVYSQSDTLLLDTVRIDEKELLSLDAGVSTNNISPATLNRYHSRSFSEVLQQTTGVYIRSYGGEGQLSSISFRGTSPNHTLITWQGVDLNSQTLGQSDASSIPAFVFDYANIYAGGKSSLFGGGNIGGSIALENNRASPGFHGSVHQEFGSFGRLSMGSKFSYGGARFSTSVALYRNSIANDFIVNYRGTEYNQNNAESTLQGIKTSIAYLLSQNHKLDFHIWFNDHDRSIQPVIGHFNSNDHLVDRSYRFQLGHQWTMLKSRLMTSFSHVIDEQTYNYVSNTNLKRSLLNLEYELFGEKWWTLALGSKNQVAFTDVDNYSSDTSQWKSENYVLLRATPLDRVSISAKVQKGWIQGIDIPLVFGGGVDIEAIDLSQQQLTVGFLLTESFRVPTFNDLFWNPGGNPNLEPEEGFHLETSVDYRLAFNKHRFHFEANLYQTNLNNMIQWLPPDSIFNNESNYWSPKNIREVRIRGVEGVFNWKYLGAVQLGFNSSYNYNDSRNLFAISSNERSENKQLPYVPFHKLTVGTSLSRGAIDFQLNYQYVGKRFTEISNEQFLIGFGVFDSQMTYELAGEARRLEVTLRVDNLTNKDYQNYQLRATPGRGYSIKLNYYFSQSNKQ